MKSIFRIIGFLEGISYLLLLGLGVYYKYVLNDDTYVKMFGKPHGVLFVLYVVLAILLQKQMNWDKKTLAIILFGSILPFGTFYVDKKYFK
jgi:integral membrane protein